MSFILISIPCAKGQSDYKGVAVDMTLEPSYGEFPVEMGGGIYIFWPTSNTPDLFLPAQHMGAEKWNSSNVPSNYLQIDPA